MLKQPIIALVDDDNIFQLTSSRIIESTHLADSVQQFYNGDEAISYLKEHAETTEDLPDIIFLDINMPVSDGWMFLEKFKDLLPTLSKHMSIYMVSSSIAPEDIHRAKSNPYITDYLTKPLMPETFFEILSHE